MAIRIDDTTIKEYADRNGLPEVYESFKSVTTQDDYNRWKKDPVNRRVVESIELESRKEKRASLVDDIKKKDPTLAPLHPRKYSASCPKNSPRSRTRRRSMPEASPMTFSSRRTA